MPLRGRSPVSTALPRAGGTAEARRSAPPPSSTDNEASDVGFASDESVAAFVAQPPPEMGVRDKVDMRSTVAGPSSSAPAGWALASAAVGLVLFGSSLGLRYRHRGRLSRRSADTPGHESQAAEQS